MTGQCIQGLLLLHTHALQIRIFFVSIIFEITTIQYGVDDWLKRKRAKEGKFKRILCIRTELVSLVFMLMTQLNRGPLNKSVYLSPIAIKSRILLEDISAFCLFCWGFSPVILFFFKLLFRVYYSSYAVYFQDAFCPVPYTLSFLEDSMFRTDVLKFIQKRILWVRWFECVFNLFLLTFFPRFNEAWIEGFQLFVLH